MYQQERRYGRVMKSRRLQENICDITLDPMELTTWLSEVEYH